MVTLHESAVSLTGSVSFLPDVSLFRDARDASFSVCLLLNV